MFKASVCFFSVLVYSECSIYDKYFIEIFDATTNELEESINIY